jgi:hypothetical protein
MSAITLKQGKTISSQRSNQRINWPHITAIKQGSIANDRDNGLISLEPETGFIPHAFFGSVNTSAKCFDGLKQFRFVSVCANRLHHFKGA